jgi:azurin
MMFLSGHDFFADGTTAAVCTMMGDVWTVAGIDGGLGKVRWRRFATGLNQPMGLCISEEKVYVLGKDQITRLHDLDGDGEADSYENFCNRFATSPGGHDYNTGLQRDGAGNFYFATKHAGLFQVSPDGTEVRTIASGFRNPNGVGVNENGVVTTGGQEGDWVPASSVIEVSAGRFYGYRGERGREVATPLCFVPRGIDNSTSGQAFIETGGRWGPVEGQIISLSYGAGTYYLVLREAFAGGSQGAVVPMDGDFLAGPNRARFNPADGQLYVTCSDGWGDYAMQDGAFHRVRFTGLPFLKPVGFSVHENGLAVSFAEPVAADAAADVTRYFAQQWEYQYSPGYGSPELSLKEPGTIGHDRVDVRSAHLVGDGRTVFVEIPEIRPVMQFHLRLHLETASGEAFRAELFPTIHRLGAPFTGFAGYRPVPPDLAAAKPESLVMRLVWPGDDPLKKSAPDEDAPGREIVIKAIPGLRYDTKEIRARAGERLSVTLVNEDAIPHNFVLAMPGRLHQVGDLANRMLNDPNAVKKQYVPDTDQVIDFIPVINEGEQETLHLNAPKSPGEYPFLCTFPGHYLLMNGVLVVEK